MSVPFVDLGRLHREHRTALLAAFARVLDSGHFVQGQEVEAFEQQFAHACGAPYAVAVSNGTAALHLALLARGIRPGDEVITVANTFVATAEAIVQAGARPVFADIDPETMNIDPAEVERRITPRTTAIVAVHLYGRVAQMDALLDIARRYHLALIEDACQAHGASFNGRPAGTIGDAGCFSFYPTKNLGGIGEGGMILTADRHIALRAASLRDHGQSVRYHHAALGYNYRMSELQAAALSVLLPELYRWNARRSMAAERYAARLAGADLVLPSVEKRDNHVYHLYVVRSHQRNELRSHLAERGIQTAVHYPIPIHLQPAFADYSEGPDSLPHTEAATSKILSLPMHPTIAAEEVDAVCDAILDFDSSLEGRTLAAVSAS
ncbi:MAG TPA: DegT/DnrJ/EryC1/StrS family aminotransferase [Dehalococcoidia bacterium]|nr:DegT/DnrJ/EryC1/StrS family aminotransferase [Dehalococcoidia bacterium]